jgi:hypothetical protein
MATHTSTAAASGRVPRAIHAGVNSVSVVHTVSGSLSAGDIIQLAKIPNGATVIDVIMRTAITPAQVVLSVGDGNDTGRFMASLTYTSNVYRAGQGIPYKYSISDDAAIQWDTVDVRVQTASGSGNSTFAATILYTMDQ